LGNIDNLEEDGFLIKEITYKYDTLYCNRPLTKEEFKQTKFKTWIKDI